MAFTAEGVYRRGIIVAYLFLFSIVADAHPDVVVACSAERMVQRG
jgi:hypothetical protein